MNPDLLTRGSTLAIRCRREGPTFRRILYHNIILTPTADGPWRRSPATQKNPAGCGRVRVCRENDKRPYRQWGSSIMMMPMAVVMTSIVSAVSAVANRTRKLTIGHCQLKISNCEGSTEGVAPAFPIFNFQFAMANLQSPPPTPSTPPQTPPSPAPSCLRDCHRAIPASGRRPAGARGSCGRSGSSARR